MMHSAWLTSRGFTLTELLLVLAVMVTLTGMAVPLVATALDEARTGMAARYLAARIRGARIDAIKRSTAVALKLEPGEPDYAFAPYADGNGNGVRTADIRRGVDPPLGAPEQLRDHFAGVGFGLLPGIPDADGAMSGTDGVRIGSARILTLAPDGTATPGTLYVRGRRAQYGVRVLGMTGRTRVMKYNPGDRTWISR
jgi:prepilin-type N-terminal cleavage/methylation domain-containing protein